MLMPLQPSHNHHSSRLTAGEILGSMIVFRPMHCSCWGGVVCAADATVEVQRLSLLASVAEAAHDHEITLARDGDAG